MDVPSSPGSHLRVKSPHRHRRRHHSPSRTGSGSDLRQHQSRHVTVVTNSGKPEGEDYELPPRDYQNPLVQESDGNFFESFTALSWRQANKRLRATSEDGHDRHPPSETQFAIKPKSQHLTKNEFELLYIEVLYTIKHKIGTTAGGHSPFIQDLYQYAQEAFGISPEDHAHLLARATEEKPPIVILNIAVIKAKDLEAKDADGFSDPYCMLGIWPGRLADGDVFSDEDEQTKTKEKKGSISRKLSMPGSKKKRDKSARDVIPAKYIRSTNVVQNTLNPVWNERFRFDLEEAHTDRLHLDIWDHDDEFSVIEAAKKLNEVKGFTGLGRYFKQVAQSARTSKSSGSVDDFLGCVTIPLQNIPSTGQETWFPLEGRTARSNIQGEIKLKLSLATREDRGIGEDDNWTDVRQHEHLISVFVQHEVRKMDDSPSKWRGDLPKAAMTILHQHAIQGDVTDGQQAMCKWIAYSRKHMEHHFDYRVLLKLLGELDRLWSPDSFSREEEECLAESFKHFNQYCLSLLSKQREVFPTSGKQSICRLEAMMQCLATVYSMDVFRRVCPFEKELHPEVKVAIKRGTQEWYDRISHLRHSNSKSSDHEEDVIQRLIELTNHLNADLISALSTYNLLYEQIFKVHYCATTYRQLEKWLGEDFNKDLKQTLSRVENRSEESSARGSSLIMGTCLFELYLALQEFCNFRENLPSGDQRNVQIVQYYQWFRFVAANWIEVARQKSLQRITKAVELDKVAEVTEGTKYSTSAVDVCCCFSQMTEFWKQLNWPDLLDAFPLVQKLSEDISKGAVTYADMIHQKLKDEGYYDEVGQFDVTEQLCITINNIEQVRRALKPLPEMLRFSDIQRAVESNNGTGKGYKFNLNTIVKEADECMVKKIKTVVDRVADKMRPDIKKDVFHLNWAPESVPADDAIGDLLTYLDSNLLTMNKNLLKTNFDRILLSLWVEVLAEFKDTILKEEPRQPIMYKRMYDALELLVDFFHANEKGLQIQKIQSEQYKELKGMLDLQKRNTFPLIEVFYEEKLQQQKARTSKEYGILNVRMCYRQDSQSLLVEVLNAKDVIPLDANGLSDPFVLLQLCPEHVFPNVTIQKTNIVKKTLNPTFEETFEFDITPEQCRHAGAVLLLTVMDHDYVFQNDFAGEVYVSLADLPGVDEEISGFDALNIVSLPMMQPKHKENGALDVLAARTWDKDADDFVKKRKKVEEQAV
ncbi:BAI1-associated protein 3-like isoform X2 [Mizuhopecten yessoensis]|uniref:BAI1-associated protein 3 n=1 Tax=Mizuhopecten yessoensis TaxID=6573 RepID=A0A210QA78_MIZYE|nr:BAI1-associated protein 3-like isoform X2 [Mizuhopecten yessoensis]OWF45641.1 BAI1-associated protein 3 [Mizuhopecten yessoensis]